MNITAPSCRLTLWLLRLAEYDLQTNYNQGSENIQEYYFSLLLNSATTEHK